MSRGKVLFTSLCTLVFAVGCGSGGASDDGGGDDGGGDDGGDHPTGPLVDPDCVDGQFAETLPNPSGDISAAVAGYSEANAEDFVSAVLTARYPFGDELTTLGEQSQQNGNCLRVFGYDLSSASAVLGRMSTIVHECGHFADGDMGNFGSALNTYLLNDDVTLTAHEGDSTDRGGKTFARSRIKGDEFQPSWPACAQFGDQNCDSYALIYLDGDPDDATFDGGDQGFNMLFEETVQYVNSLATGYVFADQLHGSISERDGILNFLWFVERYLHMARLDFPTAYDHLLNGDGGAWRRNILTVWGRAWLYLGATADDPNLGINDAMLEDLVKTPALLDEIQRLRDAEGCPPPS